MTGRQSAAPQNDRAAKRRSPEWQGGGKAPLPRMTGREGAAPQNDILSPVVLRTPIVFLRTPIVILSTLPHCHSERSEESSLPSQSMPQGFFVAFAPQNDRGGGKAPLPRMTGGGKAPLPRMTGGGKAPPPRMTHSPIVILSAAKNLPSCPKTRPKDSSSPSLLRMTGRESAAPQNDRAAPQNDILSPVVLRAPHCHSERSEESSLLSKNTPQGFFVAFAPQNDWGRESAAPQKKSGLCSQAQAGPDNGFPAMIGLFFRQWQLK